MTNKAVSGITLAILGAFISILPRFLISEHCLNMKMKCLWIAKTEFCIGVLIIMLALLFIYFESRETRLGIGLSIILFGIFSVVLSNFIGFCNGSCGAECTCSPASTLIMTILSALIVLISFVNVISLNRHSKSSKR